jgi:hypothetical protein
MRLTSVQADSKHAGAISWYPSALLRLTKVGPHWPSGSGEVLYLTQQGDINEINDLADSLG